MNDKAKLHISNIRRELSEVVLILEARENATPESIKFEWLLTRLRAIIQRRGYVPQGRVAYKPLYQGLLRLLKETVEEYDVWIGYGIQPEDYEGKDIE